MNTLIISDRLTKTRENPDVELYSWVFNRPSAENYEVVILDLCFGTPNTDGYVNLEGIGQNFYELGSEIARCLRAGGVVVATLGPVAVNDRELGDREDCVYTLEKRSDRHTNRYEGCKETSYDWLDQGFLEDTLIDVLYKKRSSNISVLARWSQVEDYFNEVKDYWTVIDGCELYRSPTKAMLTYRIEESKRWDTFGSVSQHEVWIIATSSHTKKPVAVAINYLGEPGLLVLVPPFRISGKGSASNLGRSPVIERILRDFANCIKEQIRRLESPIIPDWAKQRRAPQAAEIALQINKYQAELNDLSRELSTYDEMLYLLCGKGELLEEQVCRLFSTEEGGLLVERTGKGSSLDLFVKDKSGRNLAIEVTGTKGKLTKNDSHWADFLDYLPEHYEKNQGKRMERIVLVVNTHCELPLEKRQKKDDITEPVLNIVQDNHICVIRSCDLYEIWIKTLEGLSLQRVFDSLFNCDGLFDPNTMLQM